MRFSDILHLTVRSGAVIYPMVGSREGEKKKQVRRCGTVRFSSNTEGAMRYS